MPYKKKRKISFSNAHDRFIIKLILESLRGEYLKHPQIKFVSEWGQDSYAVCDIWFNKDDLKNKYNLKIIGRNKGITDYLEFLSNKGIIAPGGYYERGIPIKLDSFFFAGSEDKEEMVTTIFFEPVLLSNVLRALKKGEFEYILRSNKIEFNLFTGEVAILKKDSTGYTHRVLRRGSRNYKILKKLLTDGFISAEDIKRSPGKTPVKHKMKQLKIYLSFTRSKESRAEGIVDKLNVGIILKKGKYYLEE